MHATHADDLVLVAVVRQPRDLDIARALGWYRTSVVTAPKTLRVDWLAFYQTAAFGDERRSVRQAAQVRGFELVRRVDLLQNELSFEVQLGPMELPPHPIRSARWKRFTFVYTTGDRLLAARDVTGLTDRVGCRAGKAVADAARADNVARPDCARRAFV